MTANENGTVRFGASEWGKFFGAMLAAATVIGIPSALWMQNVYAEVRVMRTQIDNVTTIVTRLDATRETMAIMSNRQEDILRRVEKLEAAK